MRKHSLAAAVATTLLAAVAFTSVPAADAGTDWNDGPFQLRVRGVWMGTESSSEAFSIPTKTPGTLFPVEKDALKTESGTYAELSGEYYFTPNWSTELALAWPTNFDVKFQGNKVGNQKLMPNTWTVKYGFMPEEDFRPYLGVGASYTTIGNQHLYLPANAQHLAEDLQSDSNHKIGFVGQAGFDYRLARSWFFNADLRYISNLTTDVNFGGSPIVAAAPVVAAAAVAAVAPPPPPPPPAPVAKIDPDTDGDGVPDSLDQCPNTPRGAKVDKVGCQCDVTREVHFATGSAELNAEDKAMLDDVVPQLKKLHFINGEIEGHTDSVGGSAMNQRLSERRAKAVADYLAAHGISGGRVTTVGYGETKPVADTTSKEGRAHNRRVVIRRTDCNQ